MAAEAFDGVDEALVEVGRPAEARQLRAHILTHTSIIIIITIISITMISSITISGATSSGGGGGGDGVVLKESGGGVATAASVRRRRRDDAGIEVVHYVVTAQHIPLTVRSMLGGGVAIGHVHY